MIDNSIIVLDNINQFFGKKKDIEVCCIEGTNEMIRPLLTSMLTTCSVFLPLIFLSGISGALFYDQVIAVSISLTISYIISITLLPTLYFILLKRTNTVFNRNKLSNFFTILYSKIYTNLVYSPLLIISITIFFLLSGIFCYLRLPLERMPSLPNKSLDVYINWNENISIEIAKERLETIVMSLKYDFDYTSHIGQQQYLLNQNYSQSKNTTHINLNCKNSSIANSIQKELKNLIKSKFPFASINIYNEQNIFEYLFPTKDFPLEIGITIDNKEEEKHIKSHQELVKSIINTFPKAKVENIALDSLIFITNTQCYLNQKIFTP